jgi:cytochrome P450
MVEYDPFSEAVMRDPHPVYRRLRAEAPCYHVEKWDCWALSRFQDVWDASTDNESYSTAKGTTASHLLTKVQPVTPMINLMDPPQHTQLRSRIRQFFMPGRVAALEPQIRGFVDQAFFAVRERGECDMYNEVAAHVATNTACLATGFPLEDGPMLKKLVDRFFSREEGVEGMTQDGLQAAMEMNAYFVELIGARRKAGTASRDVVDIVLEVEIDGQKIDDQSAASHLSMFLIGGTETFPKVFSSTVHRLFEHPSERAKCIANPELVADAFNEVLRYDMPTQFLCRTLKRDVTLHGETMRAGRPVLFLYPSANRDEREFESPDVFDIERRPPRILSFGHGTHMCLGAHFARMEAKLCLEATLRHMPDYEVQTDRLERLRTEFVQGWATMPVTFAPF